jgi:cysteine synthase A
MKIYQDITKTIGSTPLVKLKKISNNLFSDIFLKIEAFNPWCSVKDRIGLAMIEAAELSGVLRSGMHIIEPTSGNTGISLAFVCAVKGYSLTVIMPETMSLERRALLLLLGAKIVLTPGKLGMRGAVAKALELSENESNTFMPRQFSNSANPQIHRDTTAVEIWNDTDGLVDYVVAGVGTGGSATGIGEVIKKKKPEFKLIVVEPTESAVISGEKPGPHKIQGIGAGFIPKNFNLQIIDGIEKVSSEEAVIMARRLIREEGIPAGLSSGAAVEASIRIAKRSENKGKMIVVILPSATERYLSTQLAEKEVREASFLMVSDVDERYLLRSILDQ